MFALKKATCLFTTSTFKDVNYCPQFMGSSSLSVIAT